MAVKKTRKTAAKGRKTTSRKTTAKKTTTKVKAKATASSKKLTGIKSPLTKTQIIGQISENTELSKKQVNSVFEELGTLVERSIKPRAAGTFTIPGLLKIVSIRKPAKKARKGINPFTGEETTFKAKPAHNVVKIRALKKLKEMVTD